MKFVKLSFIFIFLFLICCCTSAGKNKQQLIKRTRYIMGTDISVSLKEKDWDYFSLAFDEFRKVDQLLSTYKEDSEISKLNKKGKFKLSPLTLSIFNKSDELNKRTQGYFDPTVGVLTQEVYRFGRRDESKPTQWRKEHFQKYVGWDRVQIQGRIVTLQPKTKIDFGGIGKGAAVDHVAQILKSKKVDVLVLAASGDIRCFHKCFLGVRDPNDKKNPLVQFWTKQEQTSISTSGIYEKKVEGTDIHHLLVPKTGLPQKDFVSVTLIAISDNTTIDALATAVSVMPRAKAFQFLKNEKTIGALIVDSKNQVWVNRQFTDFVEGLVWSATRQEYKIIK